MKKRKNGKLAEPIQFGDGNKIIHIMSYGGHFEAMY